MRSKLGSRGKLNRAEVNCAGGETSSREGRGAGVIALASPLLTLELLSAKPFPVIGSVLNVFKVYGFRQ